MKSFKNEFFFFFFLDLIETGLHRPEQRISETKITCSDLVFILETYSYTFTLVSLMPCESVNHMLFKVNRKPVSHHSVQMISQLDLK